MSFPTYPAIIIFCVLSLSVLMYVKLSCTGSVLSIRITSNIKINVLFYAIIIA